MTNMEKLIEIEQLLSLIPAKSVDEFANVNNKKNKTQNPLNATSGNKVLSLNEISNKIHEKINNFKTNKGKKKNKKDKNKAKGDNNELKSNEKPNKPQTSKSKDKKLLNKSNDKMETD